MRIPLTANLALAQALQSGSQPLAKPRVAGRDMPQAGVMTNNMCGFEIELRPNPAPNSQMPGWEIARDGAATTATTSGFGPIPVQPQGSVFMPYDQLHWGGDVDMSRNITLNYCTQIGDEGELLPQRPGRRPHRHTHKHPDEDRDEEDDDEGDWGSDWWKRDLDERNAQFWPVLPGLALAAVTVAAVVVTYEGAHYVRTHKHGFLYKMEQKLEHGASRIFGIGH